MQSSTSILAENQQMHCIFNSTVTTIYNDYQNAFTCVYYDDYFICSKNMILIIHYIL